MSSLVGVAVVLGLSTTTVGSGERLPMNRRHVLTLIGVLVALGVIGTRSCWVALMGNMS